MVTGQEIPNVQSFFGESSSALHSGPLHTDTAGDTRYSFSPDSFAEPVFVFTSGVPVSFVANVWIL